MFGSVGIDSDSERAAVSSSKHCCIDVRELRGSRDYAAKVDRQLVYSLGGPRHVQRLQAVECNRCGRLSTCAAVPARCRYCSRVAERLRAVEELSSQHSRHSSWYGSRRAMALSFVCAPQAKHPPPPSIRGIVVKAGSVIRACRHRRTLFVASMSASLDVVLVLETAETATARFSDPPEQTERSKSFTC